MAKARIELGLSTVRAPPVRALFTSSPPPPGQWTTLTGNRVTRHRRHRVALVQPELGGAYQLQQMANGKWQMEYTCSTHAILTRYTCDTHAIHRVQLVRPLYLAAQNGLHDTYPLITMSPIQSKTRNGIYLLRHAASPR